eukprot:3791936-Rhodomonas_salina.1
MMYSAELLSASPVGKELQVLRNEELVRDVVEGEFHTGKVSWGHMSLQNCYGMPSRGAVLFVLCNCYEIAGYSRRAWCYQGAVVQFVAKK